MKARCYIHQFSKFNNFLWVRWFLGKNLSNFVSPVWKLDNPYYHYRIYIHRYIESSFDTNIRLTFFAQSEGLQISLILYKKKNRFQVVLVSRKTFYFANWRNAALSKSAKIVLSKSIFYVKNQRIYFLFFSFQLRISI